MSNSLDKTTISASALIGLLLLLLGCTGQSVQPAAEQAPAASTGLKPLAVAVHVGEPIRTKSSISAWVGALPGASLLGVGPEKSPCDEAQDLHVELISSLNPTAELEARAQAARLRCHQGG